MFKNEELKVYLGIILGSALLITWNISSHYGNPLQAFRYAIFQVAAIITTTGYGTADFTHWPMLSQCILMLLMIMGACASSTGGGIKVSRILMILKSIKREIKQMAHPKSVNLIRVNGRKIENEVLKNLSIYLMAYVSFLILSVLIVSLDNRDFGTTFSAVLTTLNNIGPGIGEVGPSGNFAHFSPLSKIVFCVDMLAGRLEIFPFLMLFTSFAWKKKF